MSITNRWPKQLLFFTGLTLAGLLAGCSPSDIVGEGQLPPGAEDPKNVRTHEGALRVYAAALIAARTAAAGQSGSMVIVSGDLSDEMEDRQANALFGGIELMDRRILPEYTDPDAENRVVNSYMNYIELYTLLQSARGKAQTGAWLLRNFAPTESPALAAHLQASEGYADVYLADMFCSGIPLSTVDPEGYTLQPGSSTTDVYQRAISLFDSAIAVSSDSTRVLYYATIGKARALLDLGQYGAAAAAVAGVPDGFAYQLTFDATPAQPDGNGGHPNANFMSVLYQFGSTTPPGMSDNEGRNGLDWRASGDPRTEGISYGADYEGHPLYVPVSQAIDGSSPVTVADFREARLIEAEAALQTGDVATWLSKLNGLRVGVTFPPALDDSTGTPRTLAPLTDPGSFDTRVDLLFRERGFWFYLTGRRLGDMRRLIRQYHRDPNTIYPSGRHPSGVAYGSDVEAPIPATELRYNTKFTGCRDRGA